MLTRPKLSDLAGVDLKVEAELEVHCFICLEACTDAWQMELPCGHAAHSSCLLHWLRSQNGGGRCSTCPLCRAPLQSRCVPRFPCGHCERGRASRTVMTLRREREKRGVPLRRLLAAPENHAEYYA